MFIIDTTFLRIRATATTHVLIATAEANNDPQLKSAILPIASATTYIIAQPASIAFQPASFTGVPATNLITPTKTAKPAVIVSSDLTISPTSISLIIIIATIMVASIPITDNTGARIFLAFAMSGILAKLLAIAVMNNKAAAIVMPPFKISLTGISATTFIARITAPSIAITPITGAKILVILLISGTFDSDLVINVTSSNNAVTVIEPFNNVPSGISPSNLIQYVIRSIAPARDANIAASLVPGNLSTLLASIMNPASTAIIAVTTNPPLRMTPRSMLPIIYMQVVSAATAPAIDKNINAILAGCAFSVALLASISIAIKPIYRPMTAIPFIKAPGSI